MRLTPAEIAELPGGSIKAFMNGLKAASLAPNPPEFIVNGPMMFPTRVRRPGVTASQVNYTYMGGEKFRLSTIYKTSHDRDGSNDITIGVAMVPADLKLAAEVSSATMTLAEAASRLDGFEAWLAGVRPVGEELAPAPPPITRDDVSEAWGAW